jgi:hypothetical protein
VCKRLFNSECIADLKTEIGCDVDVIEYGISLSSKCVTLRERNYHKVIHRLCCCPWNEGLCQNNAAICIVDLTVFRHINIEAFSKNFEENIPRIIWMMMWSGVCKFFEQLLFDRCQTALFFRGSSNPSVLITSLNGVYLIGILERLSS